MGCPGGATQDGLWYCADVFVVSVRTPVHGTVPWHMGTVRYSTCIKDETQGARLFFSLFFGANPNMSDCSTGAHTTSTCSRGEIQPAFFRDFYGLSKHSLGGGGDLKYQHDAPKGKLHNSELKDAHPTAGPFITDRPHPQRAVVQ